MPRPHPQARQRSCLDLAIHYTGVNACHLSGPPRCLIAAGNEVSTKPIPLPRGCEFLTLEDACTYITKLPKAEHTPRNGRRRWTP